MMLLLIKGITISSSTHQSLLWAFTSALTAPRILDFLTITDGVGEWDSLILKFQSRGGPSFPQRGGLSSTNHFLVPLFFFFFFFFVFLGCTRGIQKFPG